MPCVSDCRADDARRRARRAIGVHAAHDCRRDRLAVIETPVNQRQYDKAHVVQRVEKGQVSIFVINPIADRYPVMILFIPLIHFQHDLRQTRAPRNN